MMRRFLENKFVLAAMLLAFVLACGWNARQGGGLLTQGHGLSVPQLLLLTHGPSIPPDPWAGGNATTLSAHGPSIPPDPWAGGNFRFAVA